MEIEQTIPRYVLLSVLKVSLSFLIKFFYISN